jgi:hypothetical protein
LKVQMLLFRRKLMLEIVEWVLHRECLMKGGILLIER